MCQLERPEYRRRSTASQLHAGASWDHSGAAVVLAERDDTLVRVARADKPPAKVTLADTLASGLR